MIVTAANLGKPKKLLPSEKAKLYKQQKESNGKIFGNVCNEDARFAEDSERMISYYIRLNYLIPELLELVDREEITIIGATDLSFLKQEEQSLLYYQFLSNGVKISRRQAKELRQLSADLCFIFETVSRVLS